MGIAVYSLLPPCSQVKELGARAGTWVPELIVWMEFETSDRKYWGQEALLRCMDEGSWGAHSRPLPHPACSSVLCAAAGFAPEMCIQQHLALAEHVVVSQCFTNIPHPQNGWALLQRRAGGTGGPVLWGLEVAVAPFPEPWEICVVTARLCLISEDLTGAQSSSTQISVNWI